jgi:hypothetical protein
MMFRPGHRALILSRVSREPYKRVLEEIKASAKAAPSIPAAGDAWDAGVWETNGRIAQANAILAWLFQDAQAARVAVTELLRLDPEFSTNKRFDVNIAMPRVTIPYVNALDLLLATPYITAAEAADARARLISVTSQFTERYFDSPLYRETALVVTQNNHPLRTAAAVGMVGMMFPDAPESKRWLDWAVSEFDFLLGPKGHYLQPGGGIPEGPFYGQFGLGPTLTFLIAFENTYGEHAEVNRTCFSRNAKDPWADNGCVEGERYTFHSPLRGQALRETEDWLVALRLPWGLRASVNDAKNTPLVGGALLTGFGGPGYLHWDWATGINPYETNRLFLLGPYYLGYLDDATPAVEPPWKNRFLPTVGHAVFRSGWDEQARWLLLVADQGAARKTIHNHADGTSFSLAAYGEHLLIDPGYYKPNELDNPQTMQPPSHNVVLVAGDGGPEHGLLNDWQDTDSYLENGADGERVAYAEARKAFAGVENRRGVAFVRGRYFVVADRITSALTAPRTFQWRAHLWAGHEAGGAYALAGNRAEIVRAKAGLDLAVTSPTGAPVFVEPPYAAFETPFVDQFDETVAGNHAVADAELTAAAPWFLTVMAPWSVTAPVMSAAGRLAVASVSAGAHAAAWKITGHDFTDVAWLREAGASTTLTLPGGAAVESDAAFVVTAADGSFALIADGTYLKVGGKSVLKGAVGAVTVTP